ncbi:MAG TPA: DUF4124 domain-containing protein [Methylomirabilota bacterium]|nr:DUF4124 domain-containing protein [Methylomirabilota bacterium]
MRRVLALVLLAALLAAPALAQPYRWVDEQGGVHYGDRPPQPAPPTLENLNPSARQRRVAPPAAPIVVQPSPDRAPSQAPIPPTVTAPTRRPAPPPVEARPAPAPAQPPATPGAGREDGRGIARELIELAGIDRYVEDLMRGAQGDLARLAWSTREPNAAWAALGPVFRRDVVASATTAALARRLDTEHLPAVLAWLRSGEHLRIREAEIEAAKPANQRLYRRFVASLAETNPKLPHLGLIQQLERSGRGTDRHLALERALRQAMRRAVVPLATPSAINEDEEDANLRSEERTRFWLVTATLFAYRGLGSAQIEAAVRFERSPAGVWFTAAAWESLEEAVAVVEQRAAAAIRSAAARSISSR